MKKTQKDYAFWYFRLSGIVTILGALPSVISPKYGTHLSMGGMPTLTFPEEIFPLLGHWGVMVVGLGILIYLSAKNSALRKQVIWFALIEKSYLVLYGIYMFTVSNIFGMMYLGAIVLDGAQIFGGVYYLLTTPSEKQINQ